ncbi:hypothetical protein CSPHI_02225 [Corynebacterium sphenisci DSM 44792]|uniref:UmuC domain-containing protein n=1 Tax=Corynebacterium sphenisci DSM 44792 TaxID=1437874 RepID=A0A1L7CW57_9CORY|nr:DNA polymerase Y family protein [Corynebacterium sphenisci]APT90083.1 hypothetical protein CSPHI_02225 [Corynebacterium sphenisci DSM 44792]
MSRTLVIWLPDWPVQAARLAAGGDPAEALAPAAVLAGGRVAACSGAARAAGVRRGMARRRAQALCPGLRLAEADPVREAACFEPVLAALGEVAAAVEALRPGLVAVAAAGVARYHGGEERAGELLADAAALAGAEARLGAADDLVAAVLAARRGALVPPGRTGAFLRTVSLAELAAEESLGFPAELGRTWAELGLRTLGELAELPAADVAGRFGAAGARWHRVARGDAGRAPAPTPPPRDLAVRHVPEEPVTRVDEAAFLARSLAARLHAELRGRGLACDRLAVAVDFTDGAALRRVWRCAEPLTERATADRVRWQLDGWLAGGGGAGITRLTLDPVDAAPAGASRAALWGGPDAAAERAGAAAARVQGLLGTAAVARPVPVGGRGPGERVALVPVGERPPAAPPGPWPGAVPAPSPPVAHPAARVRLLDAAGRDVAVTGRGAATAAPATLVRGTRRLPVASWAGPWPVDERWWDPELARRAARMQVVVDGRGGPEAYLLIGHAGRWRVEGAYR